MPPLAALAKSLSAALHANDLARASDIVRQATRTMIPLSLLEPVPSASLQDMTAARDILELSVLLAVRQGDAEAFSRKLAQLAPFEHLPPSTIKPLITGLHLLFLLTRSEIASFHTRLEVLTGSQTVDFSDPHIKFPINLEQWLQEGSYDKVWQSRLNSPAPEYHVFLEHLVDTVRNEIAACLERTYASLPYAVAQAKLFLSSQQDLLNFVALRSTWHANNSSNSVIFTTPSSRPDEKFPKGDIAEQMLKYARELEIIV